MSLTQWVNCPVCGEPGSMAQAVEDKGMLIECTNLACASNGGTNCDALLAKMPEKAKSTQTLLSKIQQFHAGLNQKEFYDFYELMTALSSPACSDKIYVAGAMLNLKKIVRRLRITVMCPRFNVDYAAPFTWEQAEKEIALLMTLYPALSNVTEKNAVAKILKALGIVSHCLEPAKAQV